MLSASGDIAFVGFNADGNDDLAFVTFVDIGAGETIFFSDNEWNGTGWVDTNENAWSWTATSSVIPGTIITISNIGAGAVSSNLGTVVIPIAGMGSNRGLSASGETVYAYLGTASVPTVFLNLRTADVLGILQPDAIASFAVAGVTYFVTANEGDSRVGSGIADSVRLPARCLRTPTDLDRARGLARAVRLPRRRAFRRRWC